MQQTRKQCGAKTRDGTPCRGWAMPNGRCRMHNGGAARGVAASRFLHGRYSAAIPARLAERYRDAEHDPRLLELRDEVALIDARIGDLLTRVDTGESGALWQHLTTARMELMAAKRAGDFRGQGEALNRILDLIGQGHTDYRAWGELASVLEQRRRLVESERKRLVEAGLMITAEQALALIGAVMQAVKEHVHDQEQLRAISRTIDALTVTEGGD
jgi:hypothetical protein